jgi:hypothetical protein
MNGNLWYQEFGLPPHNLAEQAARIGAMFPNVAYFNKVINPSIGICQIRPHTTGLQIEQALNEIEQAFLSKSVTVPIFLNRLRSMRAMFNGTWHRIAYVLVGWNPKTNQREEPGIK